MALIEFRLPDIGDARAVLESWLVGEGQRVAENDPLVRISVGEELGEVVSPVSGLVVSLRAEVGRQLTNGQVLAVLETRVGASKEGPAREAKAAAFTAPILFAPFDIRPLEERLDVILDDDADQGERIERLRAFFNHDVAEEWERLARAADAYADIVEAEQAACLSAAAGNHEKRLELIEADRAAACGRIDSEMGKLSRQLESRLAEGLAFATEAWNKVGAGLDMPAAEEALAAARASGAGAQAEELGHLRHWLKEMPRVLRSANDPWFDKYWWWGGGAAVLLAWPVLQNFVFAIVIGALVSGAVVMGRSSVRSRYAQSYRRLIMAIAAEQADSVGELERQLDVLKSQQAAAAVEAQTRRDVSKGLLKQAVGEIKGSAAKALNAGMEACEASRQTGQTLALRIDQAIRDIIAGAPDLYGPWEAVGEPDARHDMSVASRVRIRIGAARARALHTPRLSSNPPPRLADPGPVFWNLAEGRSLLFAGEGASGEGRGSFATAVLSRILHQFPPGKAHLTLFDPLGLGRNFGAFVKLGDYSDQLINGKVWSNVEQIRAKLKDLIGHIETVTQKYLRNDFPNLEAYNVHAGEIAEPYRFLILADFPECFDEDILRDLVRVLQNGPRCGVFAIMHANTAVAAPRGVDLDALKPFFAEVSSGATGAHLFSRVGSGEADSVIDVDASPQDIQTGVIVRRYGEAAQGALKVEVPYERLLQLAGRGGERLWQESSARGISVPLGPAGVKKVQCLKFGSGLCHHGLLIGRPGSGKSNLMHVFITTATRLYSPDELQFYLVDFKQGVEFKPYAQAALPHARVIAVQSEREFGLSVLQGLEAEMSRRGDLFRNAGANSIADYREKTGEILPRIILVVDEFQEFFVRDDKIKREAALLIGRLVSQARYSGIHLLLGSQSLATAELERPVRDQMTVRIALQCSEADSRLILAEDNTAARLLSRPGEAIYNDDAGRLEGNNLFQVALFSDDDRNRELARVGELARERKWKGAPPIVFEGHEPGDIANCAPLARAAPANKAPPQLQLWLGEPTSLKPMVTAPLKRHAGRNMLVLTREEEQGVSVVMAALLSLAAQLPSEHASFKIVDLTSADAAWADHPEIFAECVPHPVEVSGRHGLKGLLAELAAEVKERSEVGAMQAPAVILVILGLQRARDLKEEGGSSFSFSMQEDNEPGPRAALDLILRDGPEVGVHALIWCDAWSNLDRALDRGLNEMGVKVAGPVSDQESRRLFDDEAASLLDRPHRMVLGDDDRVGVVEVFRPYRLPTPEFLQGFGVALRDKPAAKAKTKGRAKSVAPEPAE